MTPPDLGTLELGFPRSRIGRVFGKPCADTFRCGPLGDFVRRHLSGCSVDPFARNSTLCTWRNDINPATAAPFHQDAVAFLRGLRSRGVVADSIVLDPPYSPGQISECYSAAGLTATMVDTQNARLYARVRVAALQLCRPGSVVISFGWNSNGMGPGFELVELLLVRHGAAHNDTIAMAERFAPLGFVVPSAADSEVLHGR